MNFENEKFTISDDGTIIRKSKGSGNNPPPKKGCGCKVVLFIIVLIAIVSGIVLLSNSNNDAGYNYENNYDSGYNYNNSYDSEISCAKSYWLNGWIGGTMAVTMFLEECDGDYTGWYYYDKNGPGSKLTLSGTKYGNDVTLFEYNADGDLTGRFEGVFSGDVFYGNLYVYHSDRWYDFILR